MVTACNGRYYGGGFNPVPQAEPDDGILDFLIVKEVSRLNVASMVGKYSKGRYAELPEIITYYPAAV
jgi:diacylglycerol kinase family enzyme